MKKKLLVAGVCLAVLVIGMGVFGFTAYNRMVKELDQVTIGQIDLGGVPDGTYQGEYDLVLVKAAVLVHVADGRIDKIDLLEHIHGRGGAAESILTDVVQAQSLQVDTVTGATGSSKVILKAVETALSQPQ